ncbi:MAG TPA: bacillithiol biosynthesis cysteine-adding enzyme BshC, partial [Ferruginibacter sp.]|nr:bacillithiol biosynthesis cysteine-adding enzyme BshC [Ferruginibacter sp.]
MTKFSARHIPYSQTKAFSSIVTDYVANAPALQPFYLHQPDLDGIKNAIANRKNFATNRTVLVNQLKAQYEGMEPNEKIAGNIISLLQENTFTITTAHQPNIFTGHLYFIYKILHTIKLAETLTHQIPGNNFVPVFYMGSEDADLEELGEVNINGKKYIWETRQAGAVGRMKIDKAFIALIDAIEGQLLVEPFGKDIMTKVRNAYSINKTIEQATFELVHDLFAAYGLLVLLPDNAILKNEFAPIIRRELQEQFSNKAVTETMSSFPATYKVQAAGREINMFYLKEDSRERIEKVNGQWSIVNSTLKFDEQSIVEELKSHPERFSPNVILRPVFQEWILPNIAFIGGGGELAYWLELKKVFEASGVPYPVLVLRNSFMVVNKKQAAKINSLQINITEFFKPVHVLMLQLVKQSSSLKLELAEEKQQLEALYQKIKLAAAAVDTSLQQHTEALFTVANKKLEKLEKKMLVAEKHKFEAQQRQVEKIKTHLFPSDNLQERVDNILPYYAVYGPAFIQ